MHDINVDKKTGKITAKLGVSRTRRLDVPIEFTAQMLRIEESGVLSSQYSTQIKKLAAKRPARSTIEPSQNIHHTYLAWCDRTSGKPEIDN